MKNVNNSLNYPRTTKILNTKKHFSGSWTIPLIFLSHRYRITLFSFFVPGCDNVALVGNGFCNDETNNPDCNYDGGDCCLMNVNTDSCSDCNCLASGVITSPGFPGNYDNNLDLTWLIQVQIGQTIEINFLSFDVESHSNCK